MRVLVIGGTQFIGKHLVAALCKDGHEVAILHRKPSHELGKKIVNLQADRNDIDQVRSVLRGHSYDIVFDMVYDWEKGTPPTVVEDTAKLLTGHVGRYIFMSSVSAYGDGLNHHEGDALAPDDHRDRYVRCKAQSERALFRLHQRHGTPVVTLRPPCVYGPCNPFYREQFFWDRVRDKRPVILPGDGRRLMQFAYVKDVVWSCLRVMDAPNVVGHGFNIANARPLTQAEVLDALFVAAGKDTPVIRVPRERIARAGGHPLGPNLYFGMYFDLPPVTMVISKAQRVLGFKPTSFQEGLQETYKWYLRHHAKKGIDYTFENQLLAKERSQLAS
ncbi:NAD-dependent epimerase/dehydratase family protein [uncultured Paludibaculum sp.]|uniref:NAD-dependent epimerase/dehydratase family protein n=1 Tax=uncultured Paludibaculum sp. TaxID=1765020 RepID=UPI002AAC3A85|nr:NAD-dependent epimerase/dehydratase family protein [uncultured Paludibaculum sp.]